MPNQPKTPGHTVRVPDDEWIPAKELAAEEGETMTDVIRKALRKYVAGAVLGALILASFAGSAQASAPMSVSAFVDTVRTFAAGTAITQQTDADLITSGKALCANIAAGQTVSTYWSQATSAYSTQLSTALGVSSFAQWVSIYEAWRQVSIETFCPQYPSNTGSPALTWYFT